jgi:diguanylate cyclase (GGDEF)-like protein
MDRRPAARLLAATAEPRPALPAVAARLTRDRASRLNTYVALVCAAGLATTVLALAMLLAHPQDAWRVSIVLLLCTAADLPLLEKRVGHNVESFTFAEVCVLISLLLVPLPTLVVLAATGVLILHLIRRISLVKAMFNAASMGVGVALAGLIVPPVDLTSGDQLGLLTALGLLSGILAFFLWNGAAVSLAVALSQGVPFRQVYGKGFPLRLVICVGNAVVGLGVVAVALWSPRALFLVPPVLAVLHVVYRGYLHAMQERDVWQQLEGAARELNRLDEREVAEAAIKRACQLLNADWVELVLAADAVRKQTSYVGTERGLDLAAPGDAPRRPSHLVDGAIDEPGQMSYAALLEGVHGSFGTMRICFRAPVQLTKRERHVLRTFAYSVSSTMQNARLYSEMRQHAEAKAYEASHDSLTGLGNRALLHDRAHVVLAEAGDDRQCALLIVDLDHFKEINDTLGHAAGDVFLQQVGQRIVSSVKEADAVCRLGGDEFAVLIGDLRTPEHADSVAARLLEVLAQPISFDGLRLSIEGSVGVACYPSDACDFDELLRRADVALYQAKSSRGSFAHYRVDRDESSLHRLALAAELRTALAADQFVVHFQPQFELVTGIVVGAEALVRWQHPLRGLLGPDEFIGAVEHSGLIRDFTMVVLEKAVAECAGWAADGAQLTVAVNLSARNLLDSELAVDVGRVLLRHGLAAERLILEITETTMMSELDVVEEVLGKLRSLGIQLSVDDFGTGYSSLAFLQRVAVNEVKIDRSFVAGVAGSESDRALVRATVQLAHSLGARAVGEGVEDEELAGALRALGCDFAQGYHLGRPMPGGELRKALGLCRRRTGVPAPRAEVDSRHLRAVAGS